MPTKPDFSRLPRSPKSHLSQPKRVAVPRRRTRTGPAGSTLRRYASFCASKKEFPARHGDDPGADAFGPGDCRGPQMATETSEPVANENRFALALRLGEHVGPPGGREVLRLVLGAECRQALAG